MKKLIRRVTSSKLVQGSLVLFVGSNIISVGNFIYNLLMARFLGPTKYGELGALLSLSVLLSIPLGILNLLVVKIVSSYWGQKKYSAIYIFLKYLTPRILIAGGVITLIILFASNSFAGFLKMDSNTPIILIALSFILSGIITINKGILQGILAFPFILGNGFVEMAVKIILSLVLVFRLNLIGALLGGLAGGAIGYVLAFAEIKHILGNKKGETSATINWNLMKNAIPVVSATAAMTIFFTADVILVKHFFPANVAGDYTALSTIGKIIFYVVGPVISVMFPVVTSRAASGEPYLLPLFGTLSLSLGLSSAFIFIFFFMPKFITGILFGSSYFGVTSYLGLFSFFMAIYSVNYILTQFLLSVSYYRPLYVLLLVSFLPVVFIFFIHRTLTDVIWVNILTSVFYLSIVSFFIWRKEGKVIRGKIKTTLARNIYVQPQTKP